MGTIKGKMAIKMFKSYPILKKKSYWGNHFWDATQRQLNKAPRIFIGPRIGWN